MLLPASALFLLASRQLFLPGAFAHPGIDALQEGCLIEALNVTVEQTQPWQWHKSLLVVGTALPRIGWQVALASAAPAGTKDQSQSTYHITAKDPDTSKVLWDSGVVRSSETLGIEWGGAPLPSRQRVEVAVTIADQNGNTCRASTPAAFETGLLQTTDWKAEWIGTDRPTRLQCPALTTHECAVCRWPLQDRQPHATRATRAECMPTIPRQRSARRS